MSSLVTYLKNVRTELDHVVWPRPRTALTHLVLIILISAITALLISGLDYVFGNVIERYLTTR
jgi:preprotein translocase SecE subunit